MSREVLQMALEVLKGCLEHPDAQDSIIAIEHELAQPEHKEQLLFMIDGEMLTASQMMGVELFNFQQATGCDTAAEFLAPPEQEPVAWQERQAKRMTDGIVTEWTTWYPCRYRTIDEAKAEVCDHIPYEWRPLYTTPPQRQPLTDEQTIILKGTTCPEIDWKTRHGVEMNNGERNQWMLNWFIAFKVAIEAAHGIGDKT